MINAIDEIHKKCVGNKLSICLYQPCVESCQFLKNNCKTPGELAERLRKGQFRDDPIVPYSCNLCNLCQKVCIRGLDIGKMFLEVRQQMVQEGIGPLPQHKTVRSNQKWGTSKYFTLSLPDVKTGKCQRVFFPGCGLPSYSPLLVIKSYEYLCERMPDTGIVLNCCGEPTRLLGDDDGFKAIMENTTNQIKSLGCDEVIVACPDCYHTFKSFAPGLKITTLYEIMAQHGLPQPPVRGGNSVFAIHDSCVTRHETDLQESVRHLIRSMGYGIEELDYSREMTKCCGAGGMAANANPKFLTQVIKKRADESPYDYITYCAGCRLTFAYVKKPVLHVLDLLFSSDLEKGKLKPPPNPLVKWWNRWKLKKTLQNMGS